MPPRKRTKTNTSLLAAYTTPTPTTPQLTPQATPPAPPNGESTPQATTPAPPNGESTPPPSIQGAPSPTPGLTPVPTSSTPIEGQSSTSAGSAQPLVITSGSAACSANVAEWDDELPYISIRCRNVNAPAKQRNIASHKTMALKTALGRPLPLVWSNFLCGPDSTKTFTALVRDIGAAVRGQVPMRAASWSALDKEHRDVLFAYLGNMYDMENLDPLIREFINGRANSIYRSWKCRCRKIYTEYGRSRMPDEFKHRRSEWKWLIENEFENEAKKALCARNKENCTKNPNPINHRSGPKPFTHRAIELAKGGSQAPFVEVVLNMYKSSPNAGEQLAKLQQTFDEIKQSNPPDSEAAPAPLTIEAQRDIIISCLGEHRGTEVRGLGGAHQRPPKKRGGPWAAAAAEERREERRELEERASKAEEAAVKAQEDAVKAQEEAVKAQEEVVKAREEAVKAQEDVVKAQGDAAKAQEEARLAISGLAELRDVVRGLVADKQASVGTRANEA